MPRTPPRGDGQQVESTLNGWVAGLAEAGSAPGTEVVCPAGLAVVGRKPSLARYVKQLWERRHFTAAEARGRAFQSAKGTILGTAWLVINPFANSAIYWFVFGVLLHTSRGVPNFVGYLIIGYNFFAIFRNALGAGPGIIRSSRNLVRAYAFPRLSVVISWTVRQFLDFLPVLLATVAFILLIPPRVTPTWRWGLVVPVILLGFMFAFGLAAITTALTSLLPDLKFIWPMVARLWFFTSGIFFGVNRFNSLPTVKTLVEANPGYVFLRISRDLLIYGTVPPVSVWAYFGLWCLCMAGIGFLFFWTVEGRYDRNL